MTRRMHLAYRQIGLCVLALATVLALACAPAAPPTPRPAPPKPAAPAPAAQPTSAPAPATQPTSAPTSAPVAQPTAAPKPAAPAPPSAPAKPTARPAITERVTIRTAWKTSGNYSPFWIGLAKGFFKEEGLENIELFEGTGSGNTIKAVAAGADTFGGQVNLADMITAATQGVPVKSVALLHRFTPLGISYFKDSGIKELKDLKGKTLLSAQGSAESKLMPLFLKLNGIQPTDYQQNLVASTAKMSIFLAKKADAMASFVNDDVVLMRMQGHPVEAFRAGDYGLEILGGGLIASEQVLKEKPDLVRRVVRATLKAYQYAKDNPAEGTSIIVDKYFPALERRIVQEQMIQSQALFMVPNGEMKREWWEKTQNLLFESQTIDKNVKDVGVLFSNDFLPKP